MMISKRHVGLQFICLLGLLLGAGCSRQAEEKAFRDCPECPEMITIPAGKFMMGTAIEERVPDPVSGKPNANEEPQHEVVISQPFALGKYEVTVAQFRAFIEDTGYDASGGCFVLRSGPGSMSVNPDYDWSNPGFEQADDEPAVCVSLEHATAYTQWLSAKTGHNYYIPSEAQWEYAAKAGTSGRYFWGEDDSKACDYANVTFRPVEGDENWSPPCDDGYDGLAPVGSFQPNAFGIHDPIGNVWEWVTDCSHKNYSGAPADGSAWIDEEDCLFRIIRSGGAGNDLARTTSVVRAGRPKTGTAPNLGFRVARALGEGSAVQQASATYQGLQSTSAWPVDSEAGKLFAANCAACHQDASSYKGVYGQDADTIRRIIRDGGNNIMSMPAFGNQLSEAQIDSLADYLREQKGWD